jgi:hypothetical protein
VTLNGTTGSIPISVQFGAARLMLVDTDDWMVDGNIGSVTDGSAPTLAGSNPADDATDVPIGATIVLEMNKDCTLETGDAVLKVQGGATLTTWTVETNLGSDPGEASISGKFITLIPSGDMANATIYDLNLAGTCVDDLAGNSYAGGTPIISFTTVAASPSGPTIVASAPLVIGPNSVPQNVSLPGGMQEDDKVTILLACDASLAGEMPSGWTVDWDGTAGNPSCYMVSKIMGSSPDTTAAIGTHASRKQAGVVIVERTVNAALDGAVVAASGGSGAPNATTYTQTHANARKWFCGFLDDDDVTMSVPAELTLLQTSNCGVFDSTNGASIIVGYTAAGGSASDATNPGAFTGGDDAWQAIGWATY